MISLFILKSNIRGIRYGLGTYLRQLTEALLSMEEINVVIINYLSDSYKELTIISMIQKFTEIHIPPPVTKIRNEKQVQRYAARVIDLLVPFIKKYPNPIFQVNYPDALPIVKQLKSRFPSVIISAIHSAQWQFAFNGNKKKFIEDWTQKLDANDIIMRPIKQEKELYEISDRIISVTAYMKNFIMEYYNISEEKVSVVYNGINSAFFRILSNSDKEFLKETLGFHKNEKIVLFAGRLDRCKGLYFLLSAFAEVVKQYSDVRLVLVGEDTGPDKISQYLSHCTGVWGKVSFTGFLECEMMNKFYQVADIGIIPSIYDHCPYVALEMIGYKIPLIVSNTEGLNEMLTGDQCIYLKPSIDDEGNIVFIKNEIANAILTLLRNENSITDFITSDYQSLMRSRFSSKRMGKEMYSLLSSFHTIEVKT